MNFILIDGSYYIFYRYYALEMWWKHARKSENQEDILPSESSEFIEKFLKTFNSSIAEIDKKLGIHKCKIPSIKIVGKDCPRQQIWRNEIYSDYKGTRKNESNVGNFFKMVYENKLFQEAGVKKILSYNYLEADDCIAITAKHIYEKYPDANIWIITSDMDYLQLACDRIRIFNLKFKELIESKKSHGDAKMDLFCKIVAGDKSDNIPAVFNKCGPKTAMKYYNSPELFEEKLKSDPDAQQKYERNRKIVDFNYIPVELINGFKTDVLGL